MSIDRSSRRLFLKGAGALAIGLPLLEFNHGKAWGKGAVAAKRFIATFEHGGTISPSDRSGQRDNGKGEHHGWDDWAPLDPGESLVLGPIHTPLAAVRDDMLILRGIDNMACTKKAPYGGDHGWANVTALTAADVIIVPGDHGQRSASASIDHVLALRLAARQPVPYTSLHLMVPGHQYGTPLYTGPTADVSSETDPVAVFKKLFAALTTSGPDPALVKKRTNQKSILDGVMRGFGMLKARVSTADVAIVDAHLDHLRDLEKRIDLLASAPVCSKPTGFDGLKAGSLNGDQIGKLHVDLILAALRCGMTNVATLEIADIITHWLPTPYGPVAFDIGHSLHHLAREVGPTGPEAANASKWREEMQINRRWRMSLIQRLAEGLKSVPEGGGTMLDNSLILHTSEFSDGSSHSSADVPMMLIGKAGGYFRTGRHINYNDKAAADPKTLSYSTKASTHNLFTSVLNAFGYDDAHFGNEAVVVKGPLPSLT